MKRWMRHQFRDPYHAMRAISLFSLSLGTIGFAMIMVAVILVRNN